MLNINVDHHTDANELDLIGNFLKELAKLRTPKDPDITKSPKKTKAQPVTLTSLEPSGALSESAQVAEAQASAAVTSEPEVKALDLVGLRAALAPIIKDKKDELTALVKTYGDSLPKIDPALYPEILAKAKEL